MIHLDAMTLKHLRALAAVAAHGSITAAAEALRLTPPAIHAQIKSLEEILQVKVLQRSADSGGSQLTEEGRVVLEAAERVAVTLDRCVAQVVAMSQGLLGSVTLGVVSTGKYFAPRLVKIINGLLPDVKLDLRIGNRTDIIGALERHAVDLAIMGRPPRFPEVAADYLGPHPHGLVAAADHRLAASKTVQVTDLMDETFIARENGSGTRILMSRYLDGMGDGYAFNMVELGSNETIKQAVLADLGIAFLSLHTVTDELQSGRLVLLRAPGLPIVRSWFLVWPSDLQLRPVGEAVRGAVVGLKGSFLPVAPEAPA